MKIVIAQTGQTLFDIAVQEMGSAEGVFDILDLNPFLRLDMSIPAGVNVLVPDQVIKPSVVDYYLKNNIKPVSGTGEEIVLNPIDMIDIVQNVNYCVQQGVKDFDGVRLWNLDNLATVQINYALNLDEVPVPCHLQQSLDGIHWNDIEETSVMLLVSQASYTYNLVGIVTNYLRVCLGPGTVEGSGFVNQIIFRV